MKKSIFLGMLAGLSLAASTAYADGSLVLSDVNFLNSEFYPMYVTEETDINLMARISNKSDSPKSGVLIMAVYKEDDMSLVAAKTQEITDLKANGDKFISDTVSIPGTTGYVVNTYLWDSEENGISLSQTYGIYDRQIIPKSPEVAAVEDRDYTNLTVSWLAPEHNMPIREYEIYCNGEKVGTSKTESFKIDNLNYGTEYDIEITAKDITGAVSEKTEVLKGGTLPAAYMILGTENKYELFNRDIPNSPTFDGGFFNEVVTAGPEDDLRECRKIQFIKPYGDNVNGAANYLMFDVNEDYIKATDKEITIKITCLDEGRDTVGVEYNSPAGAYTKQSITKTGTGKWKTFTLHITDAALDNKQNANTYDFRITTGESNTTEYIQKVEVFKGLVD